MQNIPAALNEVTPKWLTAALAQTWPDAVVDDVEVIDIFDGTSSRIRLKISRNDAAIAADIPENLCLKANWTKHADLTLGMGIWANEACFYKHLRPEIKMSAPTSYYAGFDHNIGQGVILMEDLVHAGATFGSNVNPLNIDQAAAVLDELAVQHARWWDSTTMKNMAWLRKSMEIGTSDAAIVEYQGGVAGVETLLAPTERSATISAQCNQPEMIKKVIDGLCLREMNSSAPRCIIHGDTHLGNSYYLPNGKMGWLDWQLVRSGRPMRELSYFLGCSLTTQDRRNSEQDLIKHYLQALSANGIEHGMSFDDAWLEYRHWPVWGFICWALTQDEWQPQETILTTMRRFGATIDDLETYKLFT